MDSILETPIKQFEDHFHVNALGVVVLFQAFYGLLKASKEPKFIPISSASGSLTAFMASPITANAYGTSKAALNFVARRIHFENDWLGAYSILSARWALTEIIVAVCLPLDPGPVDTDMCMFCLRVSVLDLLISCMP